MLFRPIRLAIVDARALHRKILRNYLAEQSNIHVVFGSAGVPDLFEKLESSLVDVLLINMLLPGPNGNEALANIRDRYPDIKILILSVQIDINMVARLLDAGIHGCISKADEPEELLQAIQTASEGRIYRNRFLTDVRHRNKQQSIRSCSIRPEVTLDDREKTILRSLWEEKTNKEIADELFIGIRSVEKIRQDMKEKVGVRSTVGLLKYALTKRIIGT